MIDHVSIGVRDLARAKLFYEAVLPTIGYAKLVDRPDTIGFGKRHPDFWLNPRPGMAIGGDNGVHVCLRADDQAKVQAFHAAAVAAGGTDDGGPDFRPQYHDTYYAAFVRDPDGNRIEAVTFVK